MILNVNTYSCFFAAAAIFRYVFVRNIMTKSRLVVAQSVIYKESALPIPRIISLQIVAPPCGEEDAAMDKPPWCTKSTGQCWLCSHFMQQQQVVS